VQGRMALKGMSGSGQGRRVVKPERCAELLIAIEKLTEIQR
jgi:hypothetical protein